MKAHDETVNKVPSVLIIGYGWVGQQMHKYFPDAAIYDVQRQPDIKKSWTYTDFTYDYAFICFPTPPNEDGSCDTSIVDSVLSTWHERVDNFCIKSTISVGTVDRLELEYDAGICFSPEYLGETVGHPLIEPKRDTFIILGGRKEVTSKFAELWSLVTNSYTKIYQTDAKTAELVKLMENSFIATKVMFCNEFFDLAESIGVDYGELRELWLADPRVGRSHTYVYRDNRGFGGKCLPKDLNNLVSSFEGAKLVKFLLKYNKEMRNG
jgi:UDPglucose 6-dehydrogenase